MALRPGIIYSREALLNDQGLYRTFSKGTIQLSLVKEQTPRSKAFETSTKLLSLPNTHQIFQNNRNILNSSKRFQETFPSSLFVLQRSYQSLRDIPDSARHRILKTRLSRTRSKEAHMAGT